MTANEEGMPEIQRESLRDRAPPHSEVCRLLGNVKEQVSRCSDTSGLESMLYNPFPHFPSSLLPSFKPLSSCLSLSLIHAPPPAVCPSEISLLLAVYTSQCLISRLPERQRTQCLNFCTNLSASVSLSVWEPRFPQCIRPILQQTEQVKMADARGEKSNCRIMGNEKGSLDHH